MNHTIRSGRNWTARVSGANICRLCALLGVLVPAVGMGAQPRTINIATGTYGQNCGAPRGNATPDLAHRCDGRLSCSYALPEAPEGKQAAACRRDFVAEWRCDSGEFHTAAIAPGATPNDTLVLSCIEETGAGK
ncbi:conserved exported hypothetical protein [Paraburkholderia ribeironis]|uniref:Uncharacterized protein n=1 Tax=Paraburkholderia ribeironis TaxID=1247936 RepID=A0A1N7SDP7_9BURK|nr:hypothetical protein [Paraburkholderia ribeironis]SIT45538.1 conserved exported hypothetical protein [Paraburkholderia ribeironis]